MKKFGDANHCGYAHAELKSQVSSLKDKPVCSIKLGLARKSLTSTFLLPALLSLFSLIAVPTAQAITYGTPDCQNVTPPGSGCKHPNVVKLSGFDSNGITVGGTRCSGTLIHYDAKKVVILTAAHCVVALPPVATLGASFDGVINFFDPGNSIGFDDTQFITGAKVVAHPDYFRPSLNSNMAGKDWGLYLFPNTGVITSIVNNLSPAALPPMPVGGVNYLNSLNLSTNDPTLKFHAVGYGQSEPLAAPGTNPKSIPNPILATGTRSIAEPLQFVNLRDNPADPTIEFSMNPARGLEGVCFGDSGGPTFLGDSDHVGVLVAVTSWGDVNCRATDQPARTDLPIFLNMINVCAKDPTKTVDDVIQCVQTRAFEN